MDVGALHRAGETLLFISDYPQLMYLIFGTDIDVHLLFSKTDQRGFKLGAAVENIADYAVQLFQLAHRHVDNCRAGF